MTDLQLKLEAFNVRLGQLVTELPLFLGTHPEKTICLEIPVLSDDLPTSEEQHHRILGWIETWIHEGTIRAPRLGEEIEITWTGLRQLCASKVWMGSFVWQKKEPSPDWKNGFSCKDIDAPAIMEDVQRIGEQPLLTPEQEKTIWNMVKHFSKDEQNGWLLPKDVADELSKEALTTQLTIKEQEDADVALVDSWNERRRASIYMILYHQGMREHEAREILRKVK